MSARTSPRFDLFFEGGACIVKARGPLHAGAARIEELSMNTEVGGAFDMRGGTERVRHRRSRLGAATARVPFGALRAHAAPSGLRVRFEPLGNNALRIEVEDEVGVLCVEGSLGGRGADLLFVPSDLRWFRAGPTSAWERLLTAAHRVGVPYQVQLGAFVIKRPLRLCVAQALLPEGWRLPDDRSVFLRVSVGADGIVLRSSDVDDSSSSLLEGGRVFATQLERGDGKYAAMNAPAMSPLTRRDMEDGTLSEAWIEGEKAPWLRADATLNAAERLADVAPTGVLDEGWRERVFRSLAVFSGDVSRHRVWAQRWAGDGDPLLLRLLDAAWAGPWARATRAGFASEAIVAFAEAADPLDEAGEGRLLSLASRCRADAPDQPMACGALGAVRARRGEAKAATELYVRAADLATQPSRAAEWRRLGAEQAQVAHGPEAAERLLEQALVESKGNARILVALAQSVADQGDEERASEILGRLLRGSVNDVTHEDALVAAARFHVERGQSDRAHPFLVRLGPSLGTGAGESPDLGDIEYREEFQSAELSIDDMSLDGLRGGGSDLDDDELFEDEFPSQVFQRPEVESTGVEPTGPVAEPRFRPVLVESPAEEADESDGISRVDVPPPALVTHVSSPDVTIVATTGDGLRALLDELRDSEDPEALLEGALENAVEADDLSGVMDVLRALDRVENLRGEGRIRDRAQRFRDNHPGNPDEHA